MRGAVRQAIRCLAGRVRCNVVQSRLTPPAQVIVTSYLFPGCKFSLERLQELERLVGKERLVVDVR